MSGDEWITHTADDEEPEIRKRVCCNCGNNIREQSESGHIDCHCAIDGSDIGYLECFEHWCRRWRKDRKWQVDN